MGERRGRLRVTCDTRWYLRGPRGASAWADVRNHTPDGALVVTSLWLRPGDALHGPHVAPARSAPHYVVIWSQVCQAGAGALLVRAGIRMT